MTRTAITLLTVVLLSFATTSAAAQPTAEERERSDQHFREGARLYHAGEYSQAILELKSGYQLAPDPVFLVNIALAYARLENWSEAAEFGRQATTQEGLSADAHAKTGARAEAWAIVGRAERVVELAPTVPTVGVSDPSVTVDAEASANQTRGLGSLGWIGVGAAGLGVAATGSAIVIGATLEDERRDFESAAANGDAVEYERLGQVIDRRQLTGQILLYSGIGLIAIGGGLLVFDILRTESAPTVSISPAGVTARWAW